jgi:hypothetical protein
MNKGYILLQTPGPLARRERRAYRCVCKERATKPAGLRAAARRGAAAGARPEQHEKICNVRDLAIKNRIPIVGLNGRQYPSLLFAALSL